MIALLNKVKYWIDKKRNPGKYVFDAKEKLAEELARAMTDAIKPDYINEQQFWMIKRTLAFKYIYDPDIDIITEDANEIYTFSTAPIVYRTVAILKYVLKKATVSEFRIYLKMSVISDSNPRFSRSWERDDHHRLIDALASSDIALAQRYAQQNMRYLERDFLSNQPEISLECSLHMLFRSLVLHDLENFQKWMPILKEAITILPECYALLPVIFNSIITRDNAALTEALLDFTKQHDQIFLKNRFGETKKGDVIVDLKDKYLFIWSIAFLNFARFCGMDVCIEHHLVPKELLIAVNHN